ncbi:MAG: hypothetical protein ABIL09_07080, partial [Gemmatimonadota bacterium]
MTPRQRLFAALAGEGTDCVPVWLLFPYHPTGYYVDVRAHPGYRPIHEASLELAVTLDRRNLKAPLHTPEVVSRRESVPHHGGPWTRDWLECGVLRLFSQSGPTAVPGSRRKLLSSAADLEVYASLPVETDTRRLGAALEAQLPQLRRERA